MGVNLIPDSFDLCSVGYVLVRRPSLPSFLLITQLLIVTKFESLQSPSQPLLKVQFHSILDSALTTICCTLFISIRPYFLNCSFPWLRTVIKMDRFI